MKLERDQQREILQILNLPGYKVLREIMVDICDEQARKHLSLAPTVHSCEQIAMSQAQTRAYHLFLDLIDEHIKAAAQAQQNEIEEQNLLLKTNNQQPNANPLTRRLVV